jgi:uncharacterized protein (DUF302 family)
MESAFGAAPRGEFLLSMNSSAAAAQAFCKQFFAMLLCICKRMDAGAPRKRLIFINQLSIQFADAALLEFKAKIQCIHARTKKGNEMLIIVESKKSIQEISATMESVVQKHKFGVLGVHNLKEAMARKGVAFEKDCIIFEICNPIQAKKVLESKMEISTALPCRVSVFQDGDVVKLATIKPSEMLASFHAPELESVAREVEDSISAIMKEVAG